MQRLYSAKTNCYILQRMSSPDAAVNECPHCRKTFSLRTNLTRHVKRLHGNGHKEVTKPLTCSACGMQCRDNYQLQTHERSHSKEKPFECSLCIYKSSRKEDVERHMKRCKGPKYNCGNCGQMFRSKIAVTDHMNWDSNCGNLGDQNVKQDVVKIAINKVHIVSSFTYIFHHLFRIPWCWVLTALSSWTRPCLRSAGGGRGAACAMAAAWRRAVVSAGSASQTTLANNVSGKHT